VVMQVETDSLSFLYGAITIVTVNSVVVTVGNDVTYGTVTSVTREIGKVRGRLFPIAVGNQMQFREVYEDIVEKDGDSKTTRYVADDRIAVTRRINGRTVGLPWDEDVFVVSFDQNRRDESGTATRQSAVSYFVPSLRTFVPTEDGAPNDPMHTRMVDWEIE
jgi:hypothetical protein